MSSFNSLSLRPIKYKPYPEVISGSRSISSMSTVSVNFDMEALQKAEEKVARFVDKEAAVVCCSAFCTKFEVLPMLIQSDCLVLVDELCMPAIRGSIEKTGARYDWVRHNEPKHLKRLLKDAVNGIRRDANMQPILKRNARGIPQTKEQRLRGRKIPRIVVIVEGLYSIEGDICKLAEIQRLKQRFNFELFVDESHSLGILGHRGGGICQEQDVDPASIDVMMGSFQTPFGMSGGFVAGDQKTMEEIRTKLDAPLEKKPSETDDEAHVEVQDSNRAMPSPEILQQITDRLEFVAGEEGIRRREALKASCRHIHRSLKAMGFVLFSSEETPIITIYVPDPMEGLNFLRAMSRQKIRNMDLPQLKDPPRQKPARMKFSISADMSRDEREKFLSACDKYGGKFGLKVHKRAESLAAERDDDDAEIDREEMRKVESKIESKSSATEAKRPTIEAKRPTIESVRAVQDEEIRDVECLAGKKKKGGMENWLRRFFGFRRKG